MSEIQTYQRRIREIKRSMSEIRSNTLQNTQDYCNNTNIEDKYKEDYDERTIVEKQEQQLQEELKQLKYALSEEEAEFAKREKAIHQDYESKIQRLLEEEQRMVLIEKKQHLNMVQQLNQEIESLVVSMKKISKEGENTKKSSKYMESYGKYPIARTKTSQTHSNRCSQQLHFSSKDYSDKENQSFQNNSNHECQYHECQYYDCCSHASLSSGFVEKNKTLTIEQRRDYNKEDCYDRNRNNKNNKNTKMSVCLTENDEYQGGSGSRNIPVRRINSSLRLQNNSNNNDQTTNDSLIDCNISQRQEFDSRHYQSYQSNQQYHSYHQQKQSQGLSLEPNRKEVSALIKKYRSNTLLTQQSSIIDPSILLQSSSSSIKQNLQQQSQQSSESQFNRSTSQQKNASPNIKLNRCYLGNKEQPKQQQQYWSSPSTISIQPSRVSSVVTTARQPLANGISLTSNILNDISMRENNKMKPPLQRNTIQKHQLNSTQASLQNKKKPQLKTLGCNVDLNRSSLLDRLMESSSSSEDECNQEEKDDSTQDYIDNSNIGYFSGQQQQQQFQQDYSYQNDYY